MESSDSNESERDEEQMSQNTNSNSASVHRRKLVKNVGGLIAFLFPLPSPPVSGFFYMQLS